MKKLIIFGFFIMALVFAQFTQAQTVDDVVEKYISALGGKEKLLALNSVKMDGNVNVQGYDVNIITTKLHMKGVRNDIVVAGVENYQIITPEKGIMFMPVQGMSSPTDMPEDQLKASQLQLDVQSSLLNYKEKGTTVELLGSEMLSGVDNYKLKLTFKNGIVSTYFIGKNDYRLNKTASIRNINGTETDLETTYTNYKQNAGGYWFAYNSTNVQGEMVYDKIETNVPVDDNIFK